MLLCCGILLYSTVRLTRYIVGSVETRNENAALQALYEGAKAVSPSPTLEPALLDSYQYIGDSVLPEAEEMLSQNPDRVALDEGANAVPIEATMTASPTLEPALLDSYQYIGDSVLPEAEEMLLQNPDTVAWIHIPNVVNLPIVYRDNTYYIDHNFYGKKADSGALFLDYSHPFLYDTQYLVVHGHSMHDGSMFGRVSLYRKQGYMEQHPVVYFNTLYREEEYEVIGVLRVSVDTRDEAYLTYTGTRSFDTLAHFNSFAEGMREHALYWREGAEMKPEDAYLALSTCYKDDRIVVLCRRTQPCTE